MKNITIELTAAEAETMLAFIDAGLKSPTGGVRVVQAAFGLVEKLTAAVKAAQAEAPPAQP